MNYDYKEKKIVCIVSDELEAWQMMNVVGHLAIGLGASKDGELMGRDVLEDASGVSHKGVARYGLIIKKGGAEGIREVVQNARTEREVTMLDFPREMLETSHDDELFAELLKKEEKDVEYLGVILYGPAQTVNTLTKNFPLLS